MKHINSHWKDITEDNAYIHLEFLYEQQFFLENRKKETGGLKDKK